MWHDGPAENQKGCGMGRLSTHVLDVAKGKPAQGVAVDLDRLARDGTRTRIASIRTNADGRTDAPLLAGEAWRTGTYELTFHVGDYYRAALGADAPDYLDLVPLRVTLREADGHYHVPLLCTPWSYSTYRGS